MKNLRYSLMVAFAFLLVIGCAANRSLSKKGLTREQKTTLNYLKKAGASRAELDTLSILLRTDTSQVRVQRKIEPIVRRSIAKLSLEQQGAYYSLAEEERLQYLAAADKKRWIKKREDRSVKKLCSTREGKIQYYGLKNLLSKEEIKDFIKQDSAQRLEWLKRFWAKRDPTPTTERNEWQEEFDRRVNYALENFHAFFAGRLWDERGDVYIKLGPPEERSLSVEVPWNSARGGPALGSEREFYKTQGETWYYVIKGKDVYLQFEDLVFGYLALVPYRSESGGIGDLDYMSDFLRQRAELNFAKAAYRHDYGGEPLDFAWEIIKFRSLNNVYEVLVNIGIPTDKLQRDSLGMVNFNQQIAIRDEKGRFISCDSVRVCQRVPDSKNRLLIDERGFLLNPGTYSVALEVRDPGNKRIGLYKEELFLPGYVSPDSVSRSSLELSRAILASEVKEAQPDERQSKFFLNGYLIIPNPSHIFLVDQEPKIKAYFEIYNLLPENDTLRFATISHIIKYTSKDSALVSSDTAVTIQAGFVPGTAAYQIIPLIHSTGSYLAPDDYLWRIDVIDLNAPYKIESIVNKLRIVKD